MGSPPSRRRGGAPAGARHERRRTSRLRIVTLTAASVGLAATVASLVPWSGSADASVAAPAAVVPSTVTKTVTATRTNLIDGVDQVVDTRTVSVTVSTTTSLRDRQAIAVSWSGAHPTGGAVPDHNSALAAQEEYPVVLMECRGVDSASAPAASQISPATCWTQTTGERQQGDGTALWPPYRADRYATTADRQQLVGVPQPLPKDCAGADAGAQHWIPFVASDGTVYRGGPSGCAGAPPESTDLSSSLVPGNTTYGVTDLKGDGESNFVVKTDSSLASLGCNQKTPCSLVAIPIMGISCDPSGANLPPADQPLSLFVADAKARCTKTGHYQPGSVTDGSFGTEDLSVSGLLWWSASNWRNRITFPLDFAQPSNVCSLLNTSAPLTVYGSEAMTQATIQWGPAFCLNPKLFNFRHVQFSEPGSRSLLENGQIEAALVGGPPQTPYSQPVVQAPVAVTGFAIAAIVDDHNGSPVEHINLTPRLIAKLLTMSYPTGVAIRKEYKALSNNPLDIVADPEFRAMNPNMMDYVDGYDITSAATMFAMSSDSDVMFALTSYINADPEARAWLDGAADPWGMVVNPNYKGISLPTTSWPVKETTISKIVTANNPCILVSPVPYLPLVAAPVSDPATIALNMQFGISNSQVNCQNPGLPNQKLVSIGRLVPGRRALFGVVSLADAARYDIPTAALLAHTASTAPTVPTDGTGRTFVAADDASLKAAAALLKPVKPAGTWPVDYAALRGDQGASAYPGIMLMSVDVPTKGLPAADAHRYAQFLDFVAAAGQTAGVGNGELPAGYLPMTAANGLGTLAAYSRTAALAVAAQQGYVPAVDGSSKPPSQTPTPSPTIPGTGSPQGSGGTPSPSTPNTGTSSAPAPSPSTSPPTASPSSSEISIVAVGRTTAIGAGALAASIPGLLALGLMTGLGALVLAAWRRP